MLYETRYMIARQEFRFGQTMLRPGDVFTCSPTDEAYLTRHGRAEHHEGWSPDKPVYSPPVPTVRKTIIEHGESQRPAPGVVTASTWSEGKAPESTPSAVQLPDGSTVDISAATGTEQAAQVVAPEKPADTGVEDTGEGEDAPKAVASPSKPVFTASRTLPRTASPARGSGRSNRR